MGTLGGFEVAGLLESESAIGTRGLDVWGGYERLSVLGEDKLVRICVRWGGVGRKGCPSHSLGLGGEGATSVATSSSRTTYRDILIFCF